MHLSLDLPVSLSRAVLLLAIDGAHGDRRASTGLHVGLIGAGLVELASRDRLYGDGSII